MNVFFKEKITFDSGRIIDDAPTLNVSYGVDKNFMFGSGVSITSVLMNNQDLNFSFHLFTDYIDDEFLKNFEILSNQFNTCINIYLIDPEYFLDLPTSNFWSYATYFRVLSFEYLSEFVDSLLYLDADVMCKGSLRAFTKISFQDQYAAVVLDNEDMQIKSAERLNYPELEGKYFNAGVLYVNLKKWNEKKVTEHLLKLLRGETKYGRLKYLDQDGLNIVFELNNIYLPNDFDCIYSLKNELKDSTHRGYKKTIGDSTVLVHYTGITKPWHHWACYPASKYFCRARDISPWKDYPLKKAETLAEMQKCYKHIFKQKKYFLGVIFLIQYKIKKLKSK